MTCDEAKLLMPDYWAQTLSATDELALDAHLSDCVVCRHMAAQSSALWHRLGDLPAEEPDIRLRDRFYESLAAYREGAESRSRRWWPISPAWQAVAAAAVLAIGIGLGYGLRPSGPSPEVAELRKEVGSMRQMVALALLQQQSASERLRGVSWANRAEPSDTEIMSALLDAVNYDANVNVRLAAIDALHKFSSSPAARKAALDSLPKQKTPMVQVALIDFLVDLKERRATEQFERMAMDSALDDGVKQRALWALETLQQ